MSHSSSATPTLGVAIIVRDAADKLRRTINSVSEIADQLVVLDTGSTDETAATAEQLGATVIQSTWNDDFSAARNECLQHISCDWVLWLDAGETIGDDDRVSLKQFVHQEAVDDRAYLLLVQSTDEAIVDVEQIGCVRLAPVLDEIAFSGRVRESMLPSINAANLSVEGLHFRIHRDPADGTPQRKQQIARRNLKLADLQIACDGPSARMLNCQADAFQTLGDVTRSIDYFKQALEQSENDSIDMLEAYCGILSALDHDPQANDAQLDICLRALEVFPVDAQLLCAMAGYLQKQGRLDLATRSYRTAFQYGQIQPQIWHVGAIHEIAAVCCSLALQLQDQNEEAEQVLLEAVRQQPASTRLRRQLIALHIKQGRREEALDDLQSLVDPSADVTTLRSAVRGACLGAKKEWKAAIPYLEAAYEAGCRDVICLRWLAVAYLSLERVDEGRNVLEEWRRVDSHDLELKQYLAIAQIEPGDPTTNLEPTPAPLAR